MGNNIIKYNQLLNHKNVADIKPLTDYLIKNEKFVNTSLKINSMKNKGLGYLLHSIHDAAFPETKNNSNTNKNIKQISDKNNKK